MRQASRPPNFPRVPSTTVHDNAWETTTMPLSFGYQAMCPTYVQRVACNQTLNGCHGVIFSDAVSLYMRQISCNLLALCTKYPAISAGLWLLLATFNQIIFHEYPSIQLKLPVIAMSVSNTPTKYSMLIESRRWSIDRWSIEWRTFRWPWGFKITKFYSEWYHFQLPWLTCNWDFKVIILFNIK